MTYEQLRNLKPSAFKRRCGINSVTFGQMVELLRTHLERTGKRGGQAKLRVEDQLLVVLEYWRKVTRVEASQERALREYRTQFHIATSWGLSESAVCGLIQRVGRLLMDSGKFRLLAKNSLRKGLQVGCSRGRCDGKSPNREPKKQRSYYRVKKKRHTLKAQVFVNQNWVNSLYRL